MGNAGVRPSAARSLRGAIALTAARRTRSGVWPVTRAGTGAIGRTILTGVAAVACAARLDHLLTAAAAEIQLLRAIAAIAGALAMVDAGPPGRAGAAAAGPDIDIVVVPVDPAAPVISAVPAPERVAGAEANSSGDDAGADIAGRGPVIRRIIGIRPIAIDDTRVVIGNIDHVGVGRLDGDDLPVLDLLHRDFLFLGRLQLVVRLRLGAQALDGVHHIGLLGDNRIAELLRPVKLRTHQLQHVRRRHQGLDAVIPRLFVDRGLQRVALEILVRFEPTLGLHDVERIGRRHQHLGEQRIGVERDRRDQLIELGGF